MKKKKKYFKEEKGKLFVIWKLLNMFVLFKTKSFHILKISI